MTNCQIFHVVKCAPVKIANAISADRASSNGTSTPFTILYASAVLNLHHRRRQTVVSVNWCVYPLIIVLFVMLCQWRVKGHLYNVVEAHRGFPAELPSTCQPHSEQSHRKKKTHNQSWSSQWFTSVSTSRVMSFLKCILYNYLSRCFDGNFFSLFWRHVYANCYWTETFLDLHSQFFHYNQILNCRDHTSISKAF